MPAYRFNKANATEINVSLKKRVNASTAVRYNFDRH